MMSLKDLSNTLRIAITDALKEVGHEGLAEVAEQAAQWIKTMENMTNVFFIAGENLTRGDKVFKAVDGLLYKPNWPEIATMEVMESKKAGEVTGIRRC